jgi:glycosyltransferase involved in cell wall biosynthesis
MPTVSVIIPNYNRAKLIGHTIENIWSQTLKSIEIIVVDDGSTDNSVDVIRSFGSKVTLICQANQGPGPARNAGLKIANGDYIQFFDSDDLCSLNKLENQAKALEASGADMAYSPWVKVYIDSGQISFENHVIQQKSLPQHASPLVWFQRGWSIVFQTCMFRHTFLKKMGGYRTDLMLGEDLELLFRMLLDHAKLKFVPDCLVLYRLHDLGQLTASGTTKNFRMIEWAKYLHIVDTQLKESQIKLDWLTKLFWQVRLWKAKMDLKNIQSMDMMTYHNQYSRIMEQLYKVIDFYWRVEAGVRGRLLGSRYSRPYQAAYPSEYQKQLINNMGYKVRHGNFYQQILFI